MFRRMTIYTPNIRKLPVSTFDRDELAQTLRAQFSPFATGFDGVPPALVLGDVMGVGPYVELPRGGMPTRLREIDRHYVETGLNEMRALGVPVRYSGYQAVNLMYGDDFMDFANGSRRAQADIVIAQHLHAPSPSRHKKYHPQGFVYQQILRSRQKDGEAHEFDIENLRYMGVSEHLPFGEKVGNHYAAAALAVGARAIVVYGGTNTVGLDEFNHKPFINVGMIGPEKLPGGSGRSGRAHLLLRRDYLMQLQNAGVFAANADDLDTDRTQAQQQAQNFKQHAGLS